MTLQEFSDHWYNKHAAMVVPYFLHSGISYYAQIHSPLLTEDPSLDISEWDGVAAMPSQEVLENPPPIPKWKKDYYQEVILPDERRFLVSEALQHIKRVPPQTVKGVLRVVIEDGKSLIDVPESVWDVWREYEKRGQESSS
ncbi:hypothetical protein F5884DRAFT_682304 [Xylogone sp. PMI_703]|nr:hypothetical protein F5884DRAFT_682304 [Xylogone sp. PMI_703]